MRKCVWDDLMAMEKKAGSFQARKFKHSEYKPLETNYRERCIYLYALRQRSRSHTFRYKLQFINYATRVCELKTYKLLSLSERSFIYIFFCACDCINVSCKVLLLCMCVVSLAETMTARRKKFACFQVPHVYAVNARKKGGGREHRLSERETTNTHTYTHCVVIMYDVSEFFFIPEK